MVYPETEEQVSSLVEAANKHDVSLIPYGGGTNVTDALRCHPDEQRTIVSVDMRRMNRIVWIDRENMMACIQAGAVGRHIMSELKKYGVTMGHEPDSVEFSTLGGWIATNASGMKKNRYGNIEDLVLDVSVVTTTGKLQRTNASPRESIGLDLRRLMFGSEGTLGIITSAVVKIFPVPEVQEYGSVLFPTFEDGFRFMYEPRPRSNSTGKRAACGQSSIPIRPCAETKVDRRIRRFEEQSRKVLRNEDQRIRARQDGGLHAGV